MIASVSEAREIRHNEKRGKKGERRGRSKNKEDTNSREGKERRKTEPEEKN